MQLISCRNLFGVFIILCTYASYLISCVCLWLGCIPVLTERCRLHCMSTRDLASCKLGYSAWILAVLRHWKFWQEFSSYDGVLDDVVAGRFVLVNLQDFFSVTLIDTCQMACTFSLLAECDGLKGVMCCAFSFRVLISLRTFEKAE